MLRTIKLVITDAHPFQIDHAGRADEKVEPEVADELAAGQEVRRSVEVRADMERHRYLLPTGFVEREPLDPSDRGPCIAGESRRVQRKVLRQVQKSHCAKRRCRCVAAAPLMNGFSVT